MTVQVTRREGESGERLLKRFSGHIKSTRLIQKFRKLRYFAQKPTKRIARSSAVSREGHRTKNKRSQYLG